MSSWKFSPSSSPRSALVLPPCTRLCEEIGRVVADRTVGWRGARLGTVSRAPARPPARQKRAVGDFGSPGQTFPPNLWLRDRINIAAHSRGRGSSR